MLAASIAATSSQVISPSQFKSYSVQSQSGPKSKAVDEVAGRGGLSASADRWFEIGTLFTSARDGLADRAIRTLRDAMSSIEKAMACRGVVPLNTYWLSKAALLSRTGGPKGQGSLIDPLREAQHLRVRARTLVHSASARSPPSSYSVLKTITRVVLATARLGNASQKEHPSYQSLWVECNHITFAHVQHHFFDTFSFLIGLVRETRLAGCRSLLIDFVVEEARTVVQMLQAHRWKHPRQTQQRLDQPRQCKPLNPPVSREHIGLFELSKDGGEGKTVDVVAVHGLQGHPYKTWEHENGHLWLQDSLPEDISFAWIMTFGYDSTVAFSKSVAKIDDKALDLLSRLSSKRRALEDDSSRRRLIVFICHSLGGIVVKKALILAHERSSDPFFKDILDNTKAIPFLGVPHKGSDSAWWANFAASALKAASIGTSTNTALVADLRKDCSTLTNISKQFVDRTTGLKLYTFFERQKLFGIVVVDESSAQIGVPNEKLFPVEADHRTICHCPSADSQEYQATGAWIADLTRSVVEETADIVPDVPGNMEPLQQSVDEFRVPFYLSNAPEIDYFTGRESIMTSMKQTLLSVFKAQRKIVVLHGLGGMGKTQSAIHFAWQHQQDFTAVLWLNAKDEDSLRQSFQEKTQSTAGLQKLVETVKEWLAQPTNKQWLLIFENHDNPNIQENKDKLAYDIQTYLPKASHGSVILTTRWASLKIGKMLEITKLLDNQDSLHILLRTSGRDDLGEEPDIQQLLKELDGLPLALATAGTYLSLESISVTEYFEHYRQSWLDLQRTSPELLSYEDRTLYSTWNLSYNHIRQQDEDVASLLQLWAYFDNQDLWYELLATKTDDTPS
ncbi:MAG: hypothetical protein M1814_006522 [Vezdaea aestivalis]|nr:MAG: hypothetical protein M1814_006522 [Vezdaea aestivalis]